MVAFGAFAKPNATHGGALRQTQPMVGPRSQTQLNVGPCVKLNPQWCLAPNSTCLAGGDIGAVGGDKSGSQGRVKGTMLDYLLGEGARKKAAARAVPRAPC